MDKDTRKKAYEILDRFKHAEAVYVNPRGEFFTEKYLGDNSLKKGEKLEAIKRKKPKDIQAEKDAKEQARKDAEAQAEKDAEEQARKNAEAQAEKDAKEQSKGSNKKTSNKSK